MDEIDVAICRSMMQDSRMPFSRMGRELDLTPQAVHRRVQALMDAGIIQGTLARLTPRAMGRMWLMVQGFSKVPRMDDMAARLSQSEALALIQVASGNMVYVHGMVRDLQQMSDFVAFVQREAQMPEVQVGMIPTPTPAPEGSLTSLDLRIVAALRADARRPVAEVARELGITVKTARRHVERLTKEGLVSFSIRWRPDLLGDTLTYLHLALRPEVDREKVALLLVKKYARGMIRSYTFSNLPNQLLMLYWTGSVRQMHQVCMELESEGHFASVVPHILRGIYYFEEKQGEKMQELLRRAKTGK